MSKKNLGYFHTAIPSAALAAAVPYLAMKKKDDETDEQFAARRRGISAALGTIGAMTGGHYVPPMLLKSAGFMNYINKEKDKAKEEVAKLREDVKRVATAFRSEEEADKAAKERARRRKEGFVDTGIFARTGLGLSGAALVGKNIPLLGAAKGSETLYHGTGLRGLHGILDDDPSKGGMRLEYAGTKGRLNAQLMPNSVVRQLLEDEGIDLSDVELASIQTRLSNKIKQNKGTPIVELIKGEMGRFGQEAGLDATSTKRIKDGVKDRLREAGMRIYFGNSPEKVVTWHDDLNEVDKIKNQIMGDNLIAGFGDKSGKGALKAGFNQQKKMFGVGLNVGSGGVANVIKDAKNQHDYMRNLSVHPTAVSREFIRDLAQQTGYAPVLGVDVPTADVQELADFKGIKTPLRLSPALQSLLGSIPGFEGYDPSRDISTGLDVAQDNIKSVDLVDTATGKATRYHLDSYRKPKLTGKQRLKSLGRAAVPLGLAGLGADMIYRAASGRRGLTGTMLNKIRNRKKSEDKSTTKTASKAHRPVLNAVKNIGKYGVPVIGSGLAANVAFDALGRKIIPVSEAERNPASLKDEVEGIARETARGSAGNLVKGIGMAGLMALGGVGGRYLSRNMVRSKLPELTALAKKGDEAAIEALEKAEFVPRMIGTALGTQAPSYAMMAAAIPTNAYERAARGQDATRAELGETPEEQMKTPWKSAVIPTLGVLGTTGSLLASGAKYFPGIVRRGELQALSFMPSLSPNSTKKHLELALDRANKGRAIPEEIQLLARRALNDDLFNKSSVDHQDIKDFARQIKDISSGNVRKS
jgi:hypothetical protein